MTRVTADVQWDAKAIDMARGLPWSAREGVEDAVQSRGVLPPAPIAMPVPATGEEPQAAVEPVHQASPSSSTASPGHQTISDGLPAPLTPVSVAPSDMEFSEPRPHGVARRLFEDDDLEAHVPGEMATPVAPPAEKRQKVDAVEDWLDREMSHEERYEARVEELKKLLSFGGLVARRKADARGYSVMPHTWVDKMKDGVAKSRFTIADLKARSPDANPAELFSPTPTQLSTAIFETTLIKRGLMSISADVVSAYPHAEEKETIFVRIPKREFIDAAKFYPEALGGLTIAEIEADGAHLQPLVNIYGRRPAGANWRDKLESIIVGIPNFKFKRLPHEPCLYYDEKSRAMILMTFALLQFLMTWTRLWRRSRRSCG